VKKHNPLIEILILVVMIANSAFGGIYAARRTTTSLVIHIVLGVLLVVLIAIHLHHANRGWITAGRALFRGDKYRRFRFKAIVEWLLVIVWTLVIVAGLLAAVYDQADVTGLAWASHAHRGLVVVGLVLAVIHLGQHLRPLWSYLTRRPRQPEVATGPVTPITTR
jgi:tryptophan-rich sensory protein